MTMTTATISFVECPGGIWTAQLSDKRRYSNRDSQAVKAWALSACPTDGIRIRNLFQRAVELRSMVKIPPRPQRAS
jgi:hypothetical protein